MARTRGASPRTGLVVSAVGTLWLAITASSWSREPAAPPPAPAADSMTTLDRAVRRIAACADGCAGVLYVWSERMPLSRRGIEVIESVTDALGIGLTLLETEALDAGAAAPATGPRAASATRARVDLRTGSDHGYRMLVDAVLASGALAHAPAVVVHADGRVLGRAILGYKRPPAYEAAIRRRLGEGAGRGSERVGNGGAAEAGPDGAPRAQGVRGPTGARTELGGSPPPGTAPLAGRFRADYEAVGSPGAYFRWVPDRSTLAYESSRRIWLLDLADEANREAPGFIDFVPTPDGRFFVTPGPGNQGLEMYDAAEVFETAGTRRAAGVTPFFVDRRMRDQYPSIGILETGERRTVYRVLTSWFEGIVYRDYEVETDADGGDPRARALGDPVVPCEGMSISTPIMSQDGREVAARDEATGTTRIFRMEAGGRCTEVLDLGVQTGKVAWHPTGRLLAFGRPRLRSARRDEGEAAAGIFVYDRDTGSMARVPDSEQASTLAFPDFVGDDAIVFLVPGRGREPTVFRIVDGIR